MYNKFITMNRPNGNQIQIFHFRQGEAKHAIGAKHAKKKQFQQNPGILKIYLLDVNGCGISEKERTKCYSFKIWGEDGHAVDELMKKISSWLENCSQAKKKEQAKLNRPMQYFGEYAENYHKLNRKNRKNRYNEDLIQNFSQLHHQKGWRNKSIQIKASLFGEEEFDEFKWIQHDETDYDDPYDVDYQYEYFEGYNAVDFD